MNNTVLTINPGSTSTKVGVVSGGKVILDLTIDYKEEDFPGCATIRDQIPIREEQIFTYLKDAGIDVSELDAVSARGVSVYPCEGGTYFINDLMYQHSWDNIIGLKHHPAVYAVVMGRQIADRLGIPAFSVNPMPTDEFCDLARMTGMKGVYRPSHLHSLNMKQVAIHHSEQMGKSYETSNYVVMHLGGGCSIAAHRQGKAIDGTRNGEGQGPIQPNRAGDFCVGDFREYIKQRGLTAEQGFQNCISIRGGFLDLLGTDDLREVKKMIAEGNSFAKLCYDAMEYGMVKWAGCMAGALKGQVDAVLLTGGMMKDEDLVCMLQRDLAWIAPVYVYPGSFETEALGFGAVRVLEGKEKAKVYTGEPVFEGFATETLPL